MNLYPAEIASHVANDADAALVLDQAGWYNLRQADRAAEQHRGRAAADNEIVKRCAEASTNASTLPKTITSSRLQDGVHRL